MTSILIPWIRGKGVRVCIEAVQSNAGIDPGEYEIVEAEDEDRIGLPRMLKKLVGLSRGKRVMFLADDCIPQPDFLRNALSTMEKMQDGWGLVGLNDGFQNGNRVATHFLGDKRLLPLLDGEFFSTAYYHCWADWELTTRCRKLGRYVWAESARIVHNHPGIQSIRVMARDPDYRRVYISGHFFLDYLTYLRRKLRGWNSPETHNSRLDIC